MARNRETRSPSPIGRHPRRDDDRHARDRRDAPRSTRRRTPSPRQDQRRHRDGDRGYDRRRGDDDYHRSGRRDRSRDRRPSPPPPRLDRDRLDRDRRARSPDGDRDRDHRPRRDDSRDRKRRRDDSVESQSKRRKEGDRLHADPRNQDRRSRESSKVNAPNTQSEEDKKRAEKLAKLEAFKKKQAEKKEKEKGATQRFSLAEMDRKSTDTPALSSPSTPVTPNEPISPAPQAIRYDPKVLMKKAITNAAAPAALGADLDIPKHMKTTADQGNVLNQNGSTTTTANAATLKATGNISGFGLGSKLQDIEKSSNKPNINLGEEEETRKKLEKLPTPPPETLTNGDAALANENHEADAEDEDVDMAVADNEEEAAAAARAAAEKREARLLEQSQAQEEDTTMQDVQNAKAQDSNAMDVEEDEADPLDAFMSGLTETKAPGLGGLKKNVKKLEPTALFENDENDLEAVDKGDDFAEIANKAKKKKDIPIVNHAKMNYEPFRKNFYTEPSELAELTDDEVSNLRFELDGIKVRGVDVPKPVQKWSQCGLGVQSLEVVQNMGFEKPTAIQAQALPAIMSGRDIIGIAKTGSGKTLAFLLPMFRHIKDQRPLENLDGPISLIVAPTRELATQIHKECRPWLKALGLRAVCAYGGAPIKDQIAELKRGAEIVVCTAGRIIDLLAANAGRVMNFKRVTYLVLDEADRMFDMGFEPQIMRIMASIRPQRQTVLFSATFPRNMEALARKALVKPVEIIVGGRSVVAPEIKQIIEVRPENSKFLRLLQLLGENHEDDDARSLIFVDRQESAEELMNAIMKRGYPCNTLHGGKDQSDRDEVIGDFKAGIFPILVATSVAARGLDVKQLKMVVNFDCPNHLEDYVHRSGRTGRAGNTGLAVTFVTEDQSRYSIDLSKALKQSGVEVPEDLQKLVATFNDRVKAGKEKAASSGFGGKGLERMDQDRDAAKARWKTEIDGEDGDKKEEEDVKLKREGEDDDKPIVRETAAVDPSPAKPAEPKLPDGIDLDGKVTVSKREEGPAKDKATLIAERAASINARLRRGGELRGNAPIDNKGPDAGAFHSTFEINDLPQKARWAVTNRTNVAKILDSTGTSITTKGTFYATGTGPGPTDLPKLYILVEGDNEMVVTQAVTELRRLAKEGLEAAINTEARAPVSGRYSVV